MKRILPFILLLYCCFIGKNQAWGIGYFTHNTAIVRLGPFAAAKEFYSPNYFNVYGYTDLTLDTAGNVFIADYNGNAIRKLDVKSGIYSVIADQTMGIIGPSAITLDASGDIYFLERNSHKIKKIDALMGTISTIYEAWGTYEGHCLRFDNSNVLHFVKDGVVYKIDKSTGSVVRVAGNTSATVIGDGGMAINARLSAIGIAFDRNNNLYIADGLYKRIRVVNATTNQIHSYVGANAINYPFPYKDSIPASNLKIEEPRGLCFDQDGNLLFTDQGTGLLYKINRPDTVVHFAKEFSWEIYGHTAPIGYSINYPGLPQGVTCDPKTGVTYVAAMGQMNICRLSQSPKVIPNPTTYTNQTRCQYYIEDTLWAEGSKLTWYTTPVGGVGTNRSPLIKTDKPDTLLYFVSQTIDSIESERLAILVKVFPSPEMPKQLSKTNYCLGDTNAKVIVSIGENINYQLFWFLDSAMTKRVDPPRVDLWKKGENRYFIRSYDPSYNCFSKTATVQLNIQKPEIPIFQSPIEVCLGRASAPLKAVGGQLKWYSNLNNDTGTSIAPVPSTTELKDQSYFVSQTDSFGCTSDTGKIDVYVHPTPAPPFVQKEYHFCQYQPAEQLKGWGINLKWYAEDSSLIGEFAPKPNTDQYGKRSIFITQTNTLGCTSDMARADIYVHPKPTVGINTSNLKPLAGLPIDINTNSNFGTSFLWSNGSKAPNLRFTPSNEGAYQFWVLCSSPKGCVSDTAFYNINIHSSEYWNSNFEVFPNPFEDEIRLTNINLRDIMSIQLYSLSGVKVYQSEYPLSSLALKIPNWLTSGLYILSINTVGRAQPAKLVQKK